MERSSFAESAAVPVSPSAPEFSAGAVIGRTFSTWSRNLVPFTLLAFLTGAPNFAYQLWTQYATYGGYPSFGQMAARAGAGNGGFGFAGGIAGILLLIATVILIFVQMAALTFGTIQHLAGRPVTLGGLLGAGFSRSWSVFATGFVVGIVFMAGAVLFVVPGIYALCATVAAIPASVAESVGPSDALKRSFALTKGRRWRIFVAFLGVGVIAWIAGMIAGFLPLVLGGGTASLVGALVGFALTALVTPLWTALPAVAYHDLRVEKEGVDTTELARVFE